MSIVRFFSEKVQQASAWCGQKTARWRGWFVTAVTPSWNALCERVHRLYASDLNPRHFTKRHPEFETGLADAAQLTNPKLPRATVPPGAPVQPTAPATFRAFIPPKEPIVSTKAPTTASIASKTASVVTSLLKGAVSTEYVSAAGKALPAHGFKNNNISCGQISEAVAILSLAPDLQIPDDKDDKWLIDANVKLKEEEIALCNLEKQHQEIAQKKLDADNLFNEARKDLCDECVIEADKDFNALVDGAETQIDEIQILIDSDKTKNALSKKIRKTRKKKIEGMLKSLKMHRENAGMMQAHEEQIQNEIVKKQGEITQCKEDVKNRQNSLKRARVAVETWQKASAHNLTWDDAIAITQCHPAKGMVEKIKEFMDGDTAHNAKRDVEGNIVSLKNKLLNPQESAAILYGGGVHWQVFIRLQNGKFALFNDNHQIDDTYTWTQEKILQKWSKKSKDKGGNIWYQSQLTFIPEWTATDIQPKEK